MMAAEAYAITKTRNLGSKFTCQKGENDIILL